MCRAIKCKKCRKTTWAGCGRHVDQVMKDVPVDDRCICEQETISSPSTGGFLSRFFGG